MDFNLTEKQALHMVEAIYSSGFWFVGLGNFDLTREDAAKLLIESFNRSRFSKCPKLYEKLESEYMR